VTKNSDERRRRGRVPVCLAVKINLEGREIAVFSRNLSLKGLACAPYPLLRENACCQVVIRLTPDIQAVIKASVVRAGQAETAIDFLAMDPQSFVHLKKLVEYHSHSPETVARELLIPAFPISRPHHPIAGRRGRKP
jgi:PilZ domain